MPEGTVTDKWGNPLMPISVKGIVKEDGKVWLRKNERSQWELPGGRLDKGEQPEQTVVREIREELGLEVVVGNLADVFVWEKDFGTNPMICIVTFRCEVIARVGDMEIQGEAGEAEFRLFELQDALALDNLPEVYKRALRKSSEEA